MKLHRKLAKLARRETYRRGWRRAQRSVFRLPLGPVLAGLDQSRLAEIQKLYAGEKYADVDQYLRVNRERVQDLKLHRSTPKRVLDLGCGGGFFLFILKKLGHSVLGLDLGQKFDWITAFSVRFNLSQPSKRSWGSAEWDFLLRDLQRHLTPGGKIFFELNPPDYHASELRDFFVSRGATVERERIFFETGLRFPSVSYAPFSSKESELRSVAEADNHELHG